MYEKRSTNAPIDILHEQLAEALRTDRRCQREDCNKPIPLKRQMGAMRYLGRAKWCSKTCERTEGARRFRERTRQRYVADPARRCERPGCQNFIPEQRQLNGLIRRTPARWCSPACGDRVAMRRYSLAGKS